MRMFTGISLPLEVREEIDALVVRMSALFKGIKWVEVDNLHITLRFLGEVEKERVPDLREGLKSAAVGKKPFLISLATLGAFPSLRYPRVYWIGVDEGKEMVRSLHDDISDELKKVGFDPEGKKFHPHVTIGRVRKRASENRLLPERTHIGAFTAKDFCLFKSTITKKGPIYDIIEKIEFKE